MALYKQPCIHCGSFLMTDARVCSDCGSMSPFGFLCPTCHHPIRKGQTLCEGCGRPLYVSCPICGKQTFVQERCEHCGESLMIKCGNRRCGVMQFFQNEKCTACGKKIKNKMGDR